jgi:hypothetical protein
VFANSTAGLLTPGQRHEATVWMPRLPWGAVQRPGPGRLTRRRRMGAKAAILRAMPRYRRGPGIRLPLPRKRGVPRPGPFARPRCRPCHTTERVLNRLKPFRRMARRDEKRVATEQALR